MRREMYGLSRMIDVVLTRVFYSEREAVFYGNHIQGLLPKLFW